MAMRSSLLQDIERTLGMLTSHRSGAALADVFEAYAFALVLQAARAEGASISYEDVNGGVPTTFVFRTSPGHIWSDARPYCHAIIRFARKPELEAHVGIFVEGKSGVVHECDIAVLERAEADLCRLNRATPRASKLVLSSECKFYAADIPLGLARSFLGLTSDVARGDRYFLVNTQSNSSEKLLSHHKRHWEHRLVPGSDTVPRLLGAFRNTFKVFLAK
jgi:hypothetical protein